MQSRIYANVERDVQERENGTLSIGHIIEKNRREEQERGQFQHQIDIYQVRCVNFAL